MNRRRIDAIERSLKQSKADSRIVLPASEEGRHRLLLDELPTLVDLAREAFGADDRRADAEYLRTLTYRQLLDVHREGMKVLVERNLANGSMDWFRALPVAEQVRLCRQPAIDWDEIDRLKRVYKANGQVL